MARDCHGRGGEGDLAACTLPTVTRWSARAKAQREGEGPVRGRRPSVRAKAQREGEGPARGRRPARGQRPGAKARARGKAESGVVKGEREAVEERRCSEQGWRRWLKGRGEQAEDRWRLQARALAAIIKAFGRVVRFESALAYARTRSVEGRQLEHVLRRGGAEQQVLTWVSRRHGDASIESIASEAAA